MEASPFAKEMLRIARHLDDLLLNDRVPGMINLVSTEKLVRRYRGLEICFDKCKAESDWRRPKGGGGPGWAPKTNWVECDRVDPSSRDADQMRVEASEAEIQRERERDALIAKANMKLQAATGTKTTVVLDPRDGLQ